MATYWTSFCGNKTPYDPFWSNQLTLNTSNPDFTLCFQRTVLTWPPIFFIWLCTPLKLWFLISDKRVQGWLSFGRLNLIKTILVLIQVITSFLMIFWVGRIHPDLNTENYTTQADYVATILRFLTMMLALLFIRLEYMKGAITSATMSFFWLFLLICDIFICRSNAMRQNTVDAASQQYFISFNINFACVILQFFLVLLPDRSAMSKAVIPEKVPLLGEDELQKESFTNKIDTDHARPNPYDYTSFWARLTFQWLTPDVFRVYMKGTSFEALYRLSFRDTVKPLLSKFYRFYNGTDYTGSDKMPTKEKHAPLWRVLFSCIGADFLLAIFIRAVTIPITFVNPQILSLLINFISSDDPHTWKGIVLAACMLVVNFTFSIGINNFLFRAFAAGMKARSVVNAVVYRKALRLSSTAKKQTTTGQIVNLMSVDAQKVQDMYVYSTLLWSVPILIALCIYFLWQSIGPSCLSGLAVMLILVPLNAGYLANKAFKLQRSQMFQKDQRFRVVNEILSGMKVLKLYAWESSFEKKISVSRENELKTIIRINLINAFGAMCWLLAPYLVSLAIFTTYVLIDPNNVLTADKTFVTLSLINILNWPLSILPLGVANTSQGIVSVGRIAKFLDLDELESEGPLNDITMQNNRIEMENASYSWGRQESCCLRDINLNVPEGSLVAIVGAVGSGKSSLISSLLGDLFQKSGNTRLNGSIAYVPQQAWILHNTLRENIAFGKPLVEKKYQKVINACALEQDLAMLPGGDYTEIGEKGINLSGGQKQRVSLARAVYQDNDIYLLDDPLSAVDAHVGKHIFDKVVGPKGVLKSKTRIFVTHGIPFLPHCDVVYVLKDGKIDDVGKYEELLSRGGAFADIIRNYLENEVSDDSDPETEEFRERLSSYVSGTEASDSASMFSSFSEAEQGDRRIRRRRKKSGRSVSRQSSRKHSTIQDDTEAIAKGVKLIQEEKESEGNINLSVIKSYIKACGYLMLNLVVWSHLFYMTSQILANLWLSDWTTDKPINGTYDRSQSLYRLSVYGFLGIGQFVFAGIEAFAVGYGCYAASRSLHHSLLNNIIRAPMSFFDTTPLGRIMNRFSKDVDVVDANMPQFIRQYLFALSPVIITIVIIIASTPIFAAVLIPLAVVYVVLQRLYVNSIRQWKRIDSVRRSPIYIHFDESVVGTSSIRAYRKEQEFIDTCDRLIDESQRPWYLVITAYRWCGTTMESIGACIVFFASLFAVLQRDSISPGTAGLSVSYALQVTVYLNAVIRTASELETYIVSVERIDEYLYIDSEAPWKIKEKKPPKEWPEHGAIQFSDYSTRYRAGLDLVLKNISCYFAPGEKIGIVGRTGAGKSSLSLALFRIIESAGGGIFIDGRPIDLMGLHDLRGRISIIPQDPVVFSGTLRSNLDPFDEYSDIEVWQALEHAHLKQFVQDTEDRLMYECGDNGEALSVGQRQLLCLARALLRKNKVLVLDEATAAVDFETDSLIQNTIKSKFTDCTILTVAHRLHTVMDYDKIMVLGKGEILELDSPAKLLADKTSLFYGMAKDAGLV